MKKSSVRVWAFLALASFHLGAYAQTIGKVSEGKYTSALNNFTVLVPGGLGMRVQDQGDEYGGIVAFHDDLGNLKSIFFLRLRPETLAIQGDPEKQRENLEKFLNEYAMSNLFMPVSADAKVLHAEHLLAESFNAYFAIVEIPGGSTMMDAKANKRLDTKRGVLIFTKDAYIYMLSSGENPKGFDLGGPSAPLSKIVDSEKSNLVSFRAEINFN